MFVAQFNLEKNLNLKSRKTLVKVFSRFQFNLIFNFHCRLPFLPLIRREMHKLELAYFLAQICLSLREPLSDLLIIKRQRNAADYTADVLLFITTLAECSLGCSGRLVKLVALSEYSASPPRRTPAGVLASSQCY